MNLISYRQLLEIIKRDFASKNFYKVFDKSSLEKRLKSFSIEQIKDILHTQEEHPKNKALLFIKICCHFYNF